MLVRFDGLFEQMLVSSVRYALGRMTHIVSDTCDYVRKFLPHLNAGTIAVMIRDIEEAPSYGMDIDKQQWDRLLSDLKAEMALRLPPNQKEITDE